MTSKAAALRQRELSAWESDRSWRVWRIWRHRNKGAVKRHVYTYPVRKAIKAVTAKVKAICRQDVNLPLEVLLHRLNRALVGGPTSGGGCPRWPSTT